MSKETSNFSDEVNEMRHPDTQILALFCDNTLDQDRRGVIEEHLANCNRCLDLIEASTQSTAREQPSNDFVNLVIEKLETQKKRRLILIPVGISAAALLVAGLLWLFVQGEPKREPDSQVTKATPKHKSQPPDIDKLVDDLSNKATREQAKSKLLSMWEDDSVKNCIEGKLVGPKAKSSEPELFTYKVYQGIMFRRFLGKEGVTTLGNEEIEKQCGNITSERALEFFKNGLDDVKKYGLESASSQALFANWIVEKLNTKSKESFVGLVKEKSLKSCIDIVAKFLDDPTLKDTALDALIHLDPVRYKDTVNLSQLADWHNEISTDNQDALKKYSALTAKADTRNFKDYMLRKLYEDHKSAKSVRGPDENPLVSPKADKKLSKKSGKSVPIPESSNAVSVLIDTEKKADNQIQYFYAYIKKESVTGYSLVVKHTAKGDSKGTLEKAKNNSVEYLIIHFVYKHNQYALISDSVSESDLWQIYRSIYK